MGAEHSRGLPAPSVRCRLADDRLAELSGLAAGGTSWYAVEDGGSSLRVSVLDPRDCSVREVRTAGINPYDVEDVALADNGELWLGDIGDNGLERETVALHRMTPGSDAGLYRLTYPDGPHDAEALLLGATGVPYVITKDPLGTAGIYRPVGDLVPGETVPLERVGSLTLHSTDTPGGPLPAAFGSTVVTGAAVSRDGTVVAVRTYTDAYLYPAPDGDVLAALRREPLRVPLPNEPQGEAVALTTDGTLLSASENQRSIRAVPGAVAAAKSHGGPRARGRAATETGREAGGQGLAGEPATAGTGEPDGPSTRGTLLFVGGLAAVVLAVVSVLRRRSR